MVVGRSIVGLTSEALGSEKRFLVIITFYFVQLQVKKESESYKIIYKLSYV